MIRMTNHDHTTVYVTIDTDPMRVYPAGARLFPLSTMSSEIADVTSE